MIRFGSGARRRVFPFLFLLALSCSPRPSESALRSPSLEEAKGDMLRANWVTAAHKFDRISQVAIRDGDRWEAGCMAALCRVKFGQTYPALTALQKLQQDCKSAVLSVRIRSALSEVYRLRGEQRQALDALLAIRSLPTEAVDQELPADELLFRLGCAHLRVGEKHAGEALLHDLLAKDPKSLRAVDAALRLAAPGFAVKVAHIVASEKSIPPSRGGHVRTVKFDPPGRGPMFVLLATGFPNYAEAMAEAERLCRQGTPSEPLP